MPDSLNDFIKLLLVLLIITGKSIFSQWHKVDSINNSSCFLTFGDVILVGSDYGIYISPNNGVDGNKCDVDPLLNRISDLTRNEKYIYAETFNGVYSSPDSGNVTLKTYNLLGEEISTLVKEYQNPGIYKIKFNGSSYLSVIYFCRMITSDYQKCIKMILIK